MKYAAVPALSALAVDPCASAWSSGLPLSQRGNEGDLATFAWVAPSEIPPNPPLKKGGIRTSTASTANANRVALPDQQAGLSLIELMVAITLGLMITTSLGYILMGSRSTYRTQDASARVQDTGRFALEFIGRQLRAAGRTDITPLASDGRVALGADIEPITTKDVSDPNDNTKIVKYKSTATEFTVQYQDSDMGKEDDEIRDCNGGKVTGVEINENSNKYAVVESRITFDGNSDGNRQLRCEGNGGGGVQPFAEEVEELQFRYTTGNGTWAATPTSPVVAVEVCIRVRSSANGVLNATQSIRNCAGGVIADPGDTRLRRTFTSVFALRNNINKLPMP